MNKWEIIKSMHKKIPWKEEFNDGYSQFIINKVLSSNANTIKLVEVVASMDNIPNRIHYTFLMQNLPKQQIFYKQIYPNKKNDESVKFIMKYFNINKKDAKEYIKLIGEKEVEKIMKKKKEGRLR